MDSTDWAVLFVIGLQIPDQSRQGLLIFVVILHFVKSPMWRVMRMLMPAQIQVSYPAWDTLVG